MQPSMNDLVVRQISALVSTTADAVSTVRQVVKPFAKIPHLLERKGR
jgi:hypothetical protein